MGSKGYLKLSYLFYSITPCHNPKKLELKFLLHVIFLLSVYSHILLFFLSNTDPILWNIFTNLSSICQMHHYQKNLSEICGGIYFMMNL